MKSTEPETTDDPITRQHEKLPQHAAKPFIPVLRGFISLPFRRRSVGITGLNWIHLPGRNAKNVTSA